MPACKPQKSHWTLDHRVQKSLHLIDLRKDGSFEALRQWKIARPPLFFPQQNSAKNHWIAWQCTFKRLPFFAPLVMKRSFKVARNEVKNASFAQRSAHRDSRIWRPELIEPDAERKRRARGRRPTAISAYPDPQILSQCNISSNYPL